MKKILNWSELSSIKLIVQSVKNNNLILGTTDTILGLFASVTPVGKNALDSIKNRDKKPYIVLLSEKKINDVFFKKNEITDILYSIIKKFWPGPLTIIIDTPPILKESLGDQKTVAIRVPRHTGIQKLLNEVEFIFSTSANLSGEPFPTCLNEVNSSIIEQVEYGIVDDHILSLPSTIIQYNENNKEQPITIVREGAISKKELKTVSEKLDYLV